MDREIIKKGSFLKLLRTSNHLSERDLAEILDVEPSDIAVWETGIKFPEDSETIEKLAKIFHVTKREIMNGEYRKDRVTEVDYKEKNKVDEDNVLSNTGKNILIVVLSCVILLILFVSIFSVSNTVNKKVNINPSDYFVSDDREEVIHIPRNTSETIVRNTVVLNQKRAYNADALLNYGFNKSGNTYSKSFGKYKITYKDEIFTVTYNNNRGYTESYSKHVDSNNARVTVRTRDYKAEFDDTVYDSRLDCTKKTCKYMEDYLYYTNFLGDKIRE